MKPGRFQSGPSWRSRPTWRQAISTYARSHDILQTPYKWNGCTLGKDRSADCAGFVWVVYQKEGHDYENVGADPDSFANSLLEGKSNANKFIEVTDTSQLLEGNIGIYQGHMVTYAGKDGHGAIIAVSTHGGPSDQGKLCRVEKLSDWNEWVPHKAKKWYRYNKADQTKSASGADK